MPETLKREKLYASRQHHWAVIGELGAVEFNVLGMEYHQRKPTRAGQVLDKDCIWIEGGCYRREPQMGDTRLDWVTSGFSDEVIFTELERRYRRTKKGQLLRRHKREVVPE